MNLFWRLLSSFVLFVFFYVNVRADYLYARNGEIIALVWATSASTIGFVLFSLLPRKLISLESEDRDHCLYCGYWLRGNESGICPECGEPIESSDDHP